MNKTVQPVRLAIIGEGTVSDYRRVPGIRLDPPRHVGRRLRRRSQAARQPPHGMGYRAGHDRLSRDLHADEIDAVFIATPNFTHREIALAAAQGGKHVMCEKPLGLDASEVQEMPTRPRCRCGAYDGIYLSLRSGDALFADLLARGELGEPRHFRSQRFLDLPETSWGWRQYKDRGGAGDLFDMTIHRIDFAIDLLGPIIARARSLASHRARKRWTASAVPLGCRRLVGLDR